MYEKPYDALAHATLLLLLALTLFSTDAFARSATDVRHFKHAHPCPSTGKIHGKCPGYVVDHIIPICAGGPDHPGNMQWQDIKASKQKDKEERRTCRNRRARNG